MKAEKITEKPTGNVFTTHEGVQYIGNNDHVMQLWDAYRLAVGITPDRKRVDIVAGTRGHYVPPTMPLNLMGSPSGKMKVVELHSNNDYSAAYVVYTNNTIDIVMENEQGELYKIAFGHGHLIGLGNAKKRETLSLDDLVA